jgi:hypothetical protein
VVAKELAEGFFVPGDAVAIDELNEMARLVEGERGFGEVEIIREKVRWGAAEVGEVASTAAGDEDFASGLAIVLEQRDAAAAPAGD